MRAFDWELLPFFLAVVRAGSLRSAAQQTNTSYGTVNRNIQALEASYGARLFHRSKRGFSLTAYGEALLPIVEEAEKSVIAARRRVEGLDKVASGSLRFSLSPTFAYDIIAPIIGKFHRKYPEIDIEIQLTAEIESINDDKTDVSLRAAMSVSEDVIARKLFQLELGIYASNEYIAEHVPKAGPDGEGLSWIGATNPNWRATVEFPKAAERHKTSDGQMRASLLNAHCGMSHMPTLFEGANPNLARVPGTEIIKGPWLWILLHSDLQKTIRVRRFVDFLAKEMLALRGK